MVQINIGDILVTTCEKETTYGDREKIGSWYIQSIKPTIESCDPPHIACKREYPLPSKLLFNTLPAGLHWIQQGKISKHYILVVNTHW